MVKISRRIVTKAPLEQKISIKIYLLANTQLMKQSHKLRSASGHVSNKTLVVTVVQYFCYDVAIFNYNVTGINNLGSKSIL